jgi:DNA-directed RNA polymerase subunit beta'
LGGVASSKVVDQSSLESNFDGTVKIKQRNVVEDSQGRHMVMGRNTTIVVVDEDGAELAVHRLPYGTHLRVDEGQKVKRGDRLAEWDPYTRPVLTEIEGTVEFEDLVEGMSVSEQRDESTGITNSVIIDWRASPRGADLRPAMVIKDKKGEIGKLSRGGEARYLLPVDAVLSVEPGSEVKGGDVLARIPMESAKTRDITGGLPRVAELFEARRPKDHAIIAEVSGIVQLGRDYKNKRRISIQPDGDDAEVVEFLIPKGRHLTVQEGDRIEKGEYLLDGHPAPHDILAIKGVEELANYLVNEIQEVYRLQGVTINDKHIEVIVRQMLQKTEVNESGDTEFLKGEQVDRLDFEDANVAAVAAGGQPAKGQPVLLGITKASLQTKSFISAASFQETTRVLTDAAVNGKMDALEGLKENVIVGRLIPAGTGGMLSRLNRIASHRDDLILEERERAAQEAIQQEEGEDGSDGPDGAEEAEEGASA